MTPENGDLAGAFERSKQIVDHPHRNLGLVTQGSDIAHAWIERPARTCIGGQRIMPEIIFADRLTNHRVAARPDPGFHPGMLVKRNALRGQLPSEPIQFLHQDNMNAQSRGRLGRGDAAKTATDDQEFNRICAHVLILSNCTFGSGKNQGFPRPAGRLPATHIDGDCREGHLCDIVLSVRY